MQKLKSRDGHVVVREGVLLERRVKRTHSVRRSVDEDSLDDESDFDEDESNMDDDDCLVTTVRLYATLFANGNIVLCNAKGGNLFSRKRKSNEPQRIINLQLAGIRETKYFRKAQMFAFEILPFKRNADRIVLGLLSEEHVKSWMRDIIRVAAVRSEFSYQGKGAVRRSDVARSIDAWQQAYYLVRSSLESLPLRMWNVEYSPKFNNGNALVAYSTWRDFVDCMLAYSKKFQSQLPPEDETSCFFSYSDMLEDIQSVQETRISDAMHYFCDAHGFIIKLPKGEASTQLTAHVTMKNGVRVLATPKKPDILDFQLVVSIILPMTTSFSRSFSHKSFRDHSVCLCVKHNGDVSVLASFPKTAIATFQKILGSKHLILNYRHSNLRLTWVKDSQAPKNEHVSLMTKKIIRGDVIVMVGQSQYFEKFAFRSHLMRPEYPVCRMDYFRAHASLLHQVKKSNHRSTELLNLLNLEKQLTYDMVVGGTHAAAIYINDNESLISHPFQICDILHAHGVEWGLASLSILRSKVSDRISKFLDADFLLCLFSGNISASLLLANDISIHDLLHAWLRFTGQVVSIPHILEWGTQNVDSISNVFSLVDINFQGITCNYFENGGQAFHTRRLAGGDTLKPRLEDEWSEETGVAHILKKNPLSIAAMVLNDFSYHVDSTVEKNEKGVESNAAIQYSESVRNVFQNHSKFKQQKGDSKSKDDANWWMKPNRLLAMNCQPCFSWFKVAFSRAAALLGASADVTNYGGVQDALRNAKDNIPEGASLMYLIHCLLLGCFSPHFHDLVFAITLACSQHLLDMKSLVTNLLKFSLDFPGRSLSSEEYEAVLKCIKSIGDKTSNRRSRSNSLPSKRVKPASRLSVLRKSVLSRNPFYALLYEGSDFVFGYELSNTLQVHRGMTNGDRGKVFTLSFLNASIRGYGRGFVPLSLLSENYVSLEENDTESRNRTTSSSSERSHDDPPATTVATTLVVHGSVSGLSNDEEQSLLEEGADTHLYESILDAAKQWLTIPSELFPSGLKINQVSCGHRHSAMVTEGGLCLTFGYGGAGRLGHGNELNSLYPKLVADLVKRKIRVTKTVCGRDHTVALGQDSQGHRGVVYSWGWGEAGRLGLGVDAGVQSKPLPVTHVIQGGERTPAVAFEMCDIALGFDHTVLLSKCGSVFTCGAGLFGRLGHGNEDEDILTPTKIMSNLQDEKVIRVCSGDLHTVALTDQGIVYSWGFGNSGALGHGDLENRMEPKRVVMLQDCSRRVTDVSCGSYHTVAIDSNGRVWSWGDFVNGQLGIEATQDDEYCTPRMVRFASKFGHVEASTVQCGGNTTVMRDRSGVFYTWGRYEFMKNVPSSPEVLKMTCELQPGVASKSCAFSIGSYHAVFAYGRGALADASQASKKSVEYPPPSALEKSHNVFFCGSTLSPLQSHVYKYVSPFASEIALLESKDVPSAQTNPLPTFSSVLPFCVPNLIGKEIVSASSTMEGWYLIEKDSPLLLSWIPTSTNTSDIQTLQLLEQLDVAVHQVMSDPWGRWSSTLVAEDAESLWASRVMTWKGKSENLDFDPVRIWPNHNEMHVVSAAIGEDSMSMVDSDGVLYEIGKRVSLLSNATKTITGLADYERKKIRERIWWMYSKYCPDNINSNPQFADKMFELYDLREDDLLKLLIEKYGAEPSMTEIHNPAGLRRSFPTILRTKQPIRAVSCGLNHSICLSYRGDLFAWGSGNNGELGLGFKILQNTVPTMISVTQTSFFQSNRQVALSMIAPTTTEVRVKFSRVCCGADHSMALSDDGTVYSWGASGYGQLGHGRNSSDFAPTSVSYFIDRQLKVVDIACGAKHSAVVTSKGTAFAFGSGRYGQLGIEMDEANLPEKIHFDERIKNVFAGPCSTLFTSE